MIKKLSLLLLILVVGITFNSCNQTDPINNQQFIKKQDFKMLFVGNSFTYYNDGVDFHLQKMLRADKSADSIIYTIQKIAVGSYTLENHYNDQQTLNMINNYKWNTVVLQEQSSRPISNPDLFLNYASKLNQLIKKDSAITVLYMTWALKDSPSDINQLADAYNWVGNQLNAKVVPVGKVWDYFVKTYPQINLYFTDNKHPDLAGTYLISCTFFYSLFGKNPVQSTYLPVGLTLSDAIFIRKAVYDYILNN